MSSHLLPADLRIPECLWQCFYGVRSLACATGILSDFISLLKSCTAPVRLLKRTRPRRWGRALVLPFLLREHDMRSKPSKLTAIRTGCFGVTLTFILDIHDLLLERVRLVTPHRLMKLRLVILYRLTWVRYTDKFHHRPICSTIFYYVC